MLLEQYRSFFARKRNLSVNPDKVKGFRLRVLISCI